MEEAPEPPMAWESYKKIISDEWKVLLTSESAQSEPNIHSFLEKHPCMLPGAFGLGFTSGHYPTLSAAISKPVLPSYGPRIPDFMWLALDSESDYPVLIEIETADKRWFTRSGKQTEEFTQALDQLRDWKTWFAKPHNVEAFKELYPIPQGIIRRRNFKPLYILVYGRRADATKDDHLAEKRLHLHREDEFVMTFDRLAPDANLDQMMCVRIDKRGCRAINIPPTLSLSPSYADDRSRIQEKATAVEINPYLSKARKEFLIRRFVYWDDWARTDDKGLIIVN